jgi:succinate-acetate transporter protein
MLTEFFSRLEGSGALLGVDTKRNIIRVGSMLITLTATLTPSFNALAGYDGDNAAFYDSFSMFLISMAILCLFYMIAALRTNICLVLILLCFTITFPLLAASYFYAASGLLALSAQCRIVGGAFAFAASIIAWYLVSLTALSTDGLPANVGAVVLADP